MSNNSLIQTRKRVVEEKLNEMLLYYVSNAPSTMTETPHLCVDKKSYRGKVLRWFEPILPNVENVVLIEEFLGDSWTLRFEPKGNHVSL